VESGEGIESKLFNRLHLSHPSKWNPVKELKGTRKFRGIARNGNSVWNPAKELNDPALTATA